MNQLKDALLGRGSSWGQVGFGEGHCEVGNIFPVVEGFWGVSTAAYFLHRQLSHPAEEALETGMFGITGMWATKRR